MFQSHRKKIIVAFAIVGIVAGSAVAEKFVRHEFAEDGHGYMMSHISQQLSLTDQQQHMLTSIFEDVQKYRQSLHGKTQEQVQAALIKDSLSKDEALHLLKLRQQQRDDLQSYMAEKLVAFHALLDKKQRQEAINLLLAFSNRGNMKFYHGERRQFMPISPYRSWHKDYYNHDHSWHRNHHNRYDYR